MATTITITLDDDIFADYAESVGAYSDDATVVAQLVTEAIERHIVQAAGRALTNRAASAAYAEAKAAQQAREAKLQARQDEENT